MHRKLLQLKIRMFLLLTAVYFIIGLLSFAVFYLFIPQYYFSFYPAIGVFYWITGIIFNFFLDRVRATQPDQLLNVYMLGRMIKFIVTLLFLIIGVRYAQHAKIAFGISLMCNFIIYSLFDLYIYYLYNKRITRNVHK